jgi:endonuclease/exonuclease/phosphatase family metal-dependent hydrolase
VRSDRSAALTPLLGLALAVVMISALSACGDASTTPESTGADDAPISVRIALFNIKELATEKILAVDAHGAGQHPQLLAAARIVQRIRPDILVLNEIDHDLQTAPEDLALNARRFDASYLARGANPIHFEHAFAAPCNTGRLSGVDLNDDGIVAGPDDPPEVFAADCFGYGIYPGQYSMAVLSKLPLEANAVRTFQRLRWRELPGHHMPEGFFTEQAEAVLRLSSKSHWDLPVRIGEASLHLLVAHPTPPGFDGEENRNGRRNFDEIKLWADYLDPQCPIPDDSGRRGGLPPDTPFVIAGDLNAAPGSDAAVLDGMTAIDQLLEHPRVQDTGDACTSRGALDNREPGPPAHHERATAVFGDGVRIDYLLPSAGLDVLDGGVFWPAATDDPEGAALAEAASDHRLVWIDLAVPLRTDSGP